MSRASIILVVFILTAAANPAAAGRRGVTEYAAIEAHGALLFTATRDDGDRPSARGFTGWLRVGTLTYRHVYWTIAELGGGYADVGELGGVFGVLGTEVGYPFDFGRFSPHKMKLGMTAGIGGAMYGYDRSDVVYGAGPLVFSPTLRYAFETPLNVTIGACWRAVIPVPAQTDFFPILVLVGLDFGLTSS